MLEPIKIEPTEDHPFILLDAQNGHFEISGRSLPEDAYEFYAPIQIWLEKYVKMPNEHTDFIFKLDYFNSSSARRIVELLMILEDIKQTGKTVCAKWYYSHEDTLIKERGEEIQSIIEIPVEVLAY